MRLDNDIIRLARSFNEAAKPNAPPIKKSVSPPAHISLSSHFAKSVLLYNLPFSSNKISLLLALCLVKNISASCFLQISPSVLLLGL